MISPHKCLTLLIAICPLFYIAQIKMPDKKSIGITKELETNISYTKQGISKGIGMNLKKANHQIGLGVKAIPGNTQVHRFLPIALYADYRYYMNTSKNWQPFLNTYYSNTLSKNNTLNKNDAVNTRSVQNEIFLGYGISFKMGHFRITNSVTYGGYIEIKKDLYSNRKSTTVQMSQQLKLSVAYDF